MSRIIRTVIKSQLAPNPIGPYSQAVKVDNMIYCSGCIGIDTETMQIVKGGPNPETRMALTHLKNILIAADSDISKVVKATVFLNDINDFNVVNEVYKEFFKEPYPARSCFQVGKLPVGALVEIEAIAISGNIHNNL